MANKTIKITEIDLDGETGLILKMYAEGGTTVVNGSGDTLTAGAGGVFTATVTEALAGVYDCVIFDTDSTTPLTNRGDLQTKVWIPGDIAGTYTAGALAEQSRYILNYQVYPSVERSITDDKAISFMFPLPSVTFTTKTVSIDGATATNVTGAITYEEQIGSYYRYELAFNVADRPTDEGTALYTFSDGANTVYVTLRVKSSGLTDEQVAKIDLIGTGQAFISAKPVSTRGKITEIIIGDDYLAENGNQFQFTIVPPSSGFVAGTSTCFFGGESSATSTSWLVSGSITVSGSNWLLNFNLPRATTGALEEGAYKWSVEVRNADNEEITRIRSNGEETLVIPKQT